MAMAKGMPRTVGKAEESPGLTTVAANVTLDQLKEELQRFADDVFRPQFREVLTSLEDIQNKQQPMLKEWPSLQQEDLQVLKTSSHALPEKDKQEGNWVARMRLKMSAEEEHAASQDPIGQAKAEPTRKKVKSRSKSRAGYAKRPQETVALDISSSSAPLSKAPTEDVNAEDANAEPDTIHSARSLLASESTEECHGGVVGRTSLVTVRSKKRKLEDYDVLLDEESDAEEVAHVPIMIAFIRSPSFEYMGASVILLNLIFMGAQADYTLRHIGEEPPDIYAIINLVFCAAFSIELAIRIVAEGPAQFFWSSRDLHWNLFDIVVVGFQILEDVVPRILLGSWVLPHGGGQGHGRFNFSFLRVLRVLRTLRILRVVRMCKFVTELRILLVTLGGSIKSLFWTCCLLVVLAYSFGLYITQIIQDHALADPYSMSDKRSIEGYFGSLAKTMWTLYLAVSNGLEWNKPASVLFQLVNPFAAPAFAIYIAFTVFALLNIITGIFLNTAMATAEADRHSNMVEQIRRIFVAADVDKSGEVSLLEFDSQLKDPEMEVYLRGIGWRTDQALELFNILDTDGSGEINVDEFIAGCTRLQGECKAVDFAAFMCEFQKLNARIREHMFIVEKVLNFLETKAQTSE